MIEVAAEPFPYRFDPTRTALVVIDMQRDFLEPGGFGETLGNDLAPVVAIIPTVAALIQTFRDKGWMILHTRESHAPDLSDCPPAKRHRCASATTGRWAEFSCAANRAPRLSRPAPPRPARSWSTSPAKACSTPLTLRKS